MVLLYGSSGYRQASEKLTDGSGRLPESAPNVWDLVSEPNAQAMKYRFSLALFRYHQRILASHQEFWPSELNHERTKNENMKEANQ